MVQALEFCGQSVPWDLSDTDSVPTGEVKVFLRKISWEPSLSSVGNTLRVLGILPREYLGINSVKAAGVGR